VHVNKPSRIHLFFFYLRTKIAAILCHKGHLKNCASFVQFPVGITSTEASDFEGNLDLKIRGEQADIRTTNCRRLSSAVHLGF